MKHFFLIYDKNQIELSTTQHFCWESFFFGELDTNYWQKPFLCKCFLYFFRVFEVGDLNLRSEGARIYRRIRPSFIVYKIFRCLRWPCVKIIESFPTTHSHVTLLMMAIIRVGSRDSLMYTRKRTLYQGASSSVKINDVLVSWLCAPWSSGYN